MNDNKINLENTKFLNLFESIKEGGRKGQKAETDFFTLFSEKIKGIISSFFNDESKREDIAQDVFMKIFEEIQSGNFDECNSEKRRNIGAFIRKVAKNYCIEITKSAGEKNRKNQYPFSEEVYFQEEEIFDKEKYASLILKLIDKIKVDKKKIELYKKVFSMRFKKIKYEEISEILNVKESTLKSIYSKLKGYMKNFVEENKIETLDDLLDYLEEY